MRWYIALGAGVFLALPAQAQVTELPAYAYDALAEISMVTTAQAHCEGARVNDRRLQKSMAAFMTELAGDGIDPIAAVQFIDTEEGKAEMALREVAFRTRHSVAPEGYPALCLAIKSELEENRDLAKIIKLR